LIASPKPYHYTITMPLLSPVSIHTQSLALRASQALALASSQSWLPLLRPSIIGWRLRLLLENAFLAVFVYATHATQAIAFGWKPGVTSPKLPPFFVSFGWDQRWCTIYHTTVTPLAVSAKINSVKLTTAHCKNVTKYMYTLSIYCKLE